MAATIVPLRPQPAAEPWPTPPSDVVFVDCGDHVIQSASTLGRRSFPTARLLLACPADELTVIVAAFAGKLEER